MKIRYIALILLLIFSSNVFSEEITKENNSELEITNLGNWLVGQMISEETMMVYLNISQAEFEEYTASNNIGTIDIEFAKKSIEDDAIVSFGNVIISNINTFNVTSWTYQIENVDALNWEYLARVQHNGIVVKCPDLSIIPLVEDTPVVEYEEEQPVELPEYECGENYTYDNITNQTGLTSATSGDVFFIGGMPVLIDVVSGGNGNYSGSGIIPVPFGDKTVRVEFSNISVNNEYVVYQGNMTAISDDPANYPDFNPDTGPLNIGGDICLPPPPPPGYDSEGVDQVTGLNSWGFNPETGLHNETGTAYDPNGFDANGNHASTGTPFNEQGCNRDGVNAAGEPCDPSGGSNPAAENFAEEHADSLRLQIINLALGIQSELSDSLNVLGCGGIKTQMEGLITTLGFERDFIFGENDRYVNEDMHLEFEKEPKSMVLNANRDENVELLEEKHIQLYHCDKTRFKLNALYTAISALLQGNNLSSSIIENISNWTTYQYTIYSNDPEKLEEWILTQIGDMMWGESNLGDAYVIGDEIPSPTRHVSVNALNTAFEINNNNRYYNTTASIDDEMFFDNTGISLNELSFYFLQGDQTINGIDRAFFLEELAKQQAAIVYNGEENLLPLKIEKTVGNKTYTIYLDGIEFTPSGAILDAYIIITDPETGKKLVFRALDISFGPTGVHTESRLYLATDIEIRLSNAAMLVLKGTEDTYVAWDCEGFSSMGVDAEIEFCRNFIIPLDDNLEPLPDDERYRLSISVQEISSWLEFYLVVNAPPFAVAEYPDVKWSLTNMILDFSSEETPQFTPLAGYESPYWNGTEMSPLWKGFFVENLSATLPNSFGSGDQPITASAFNILIDGTGFTGGLAIDNVLSMEDGNMAGWPISIEDFELRILNNQFAGAGIGGQIKVPVFEEAMVYEAVMYPGDEISFSVSPLTNVTMDLFLADVEISSNSEIKIGKIDGEFVAVATLNGKMVVNTGGAAGAAISLEVPDITFQDFQVSNQAPYFSPGTWGLAGGLGVEIGFNGFGLSLSNIQPYDAGEQKAGVSFNMGINLVDALDISAAGSFAIEGELIEENGQQRWIYERVIVNAIYIDASFPSTEIEGILQWYGNGGTPDPVWGEGFRGMLRAKFKGFDIELSAATQFGKKDDYKYFFVDALVDLGAGIGTGAIQLKGFGGGISYHMDITQSNVNLLTTSGSTLPPLGATFSGTVYTPNPDIGLGLKATVLISTVKEEVFNGTVSLIFVFNSGNGLEKMTLQGSGQFLEGLNFDILPDFIPDAVAPPASAGAKLTAFIDLTFNFSEPSFHGSLNVFLNAGPIHGVGPGGKMVDAQLHFDATEWYIYIGKPAEGQRCGMVFDVPGIGSLETTAYLDIGTNVPTMPDLPENVQEIAHLVSSNTALRNSGAGFVFGAALSFDISAEIGSLASAELSASSGFDMMLKKYDGLSCGSIEQIGIDGWYASGQMWSYVSGELKVFGVSILSTGLAAVLQARLPNPFFAQATAEMKVKILFKTVTKSLKLTLGDDCILASSNPNSEVGMDIITMLEPFDTAEDVQTNVRPRAFLSLELNKNYDIPDLNGSLQTYKVSYASTSLISSEGYHISHTIEYEEPRNSFRLIPSAMLPANDEITFEVSLNIYKNGELLAEETKSVTFTTGEPLAYIPESNIDAAYPMDGMVNFYKEEYNQHKGYVKLISGQADLLLNIPEGKVQKVRFTSAAGEVFCEDYTYNVSSKELSFPMSPSLFENGEMYKMEIVRVDETDDCNTVPLPVATATPVGNAKGGGTGIESEPVLYSLYFRVSNYNTFNDKVEDITSVPNTNLMTFIVDDFEMFDILEVKETQKYEPLVKYTADLNNNWINLDVRPAFELLDVYLSNLDISADDLKYEVGVTLAGLTISATDFLSNEPFRVTGRQRIKYDLDESASLLFNESVEGSLAEVTFFVADTDYTVEGGGNEGEGTNSLYAQIEAALAQIEEGLPEIRPGSYPVTVQYKLPGKSVTTSTTITFVK